jgi:DNA-binding CsgD family transcriptional regulator
VTLSPLQLEIFRALAAGERPKSILRRTATVFTHCRRVRVKLGARTTIQAVAMLVREGVL